MDRPRLYLITPVYHRPRLTHVCLQQHRWTLDQLRQQGIDAHEIVVGHPEDLTSAHELGLQTFEVDHNRLGRKINQAIEHACVDHDATHVAYCGSDDWVHPDYLAQLPTPGVIRTGTWRAVVGDEGHRLIVTRMAATQGLAIGAPGIAPWIIPRDLLAATGFRPADDHRMSGIDSSIRRNIAVAHIRQRIASPRRIRLAANRVTLFETANVHELQRVGFKGGNEQITGWQQAETYRPDGRVIDTDQVYETLAERYPAWLCDLMAVFYSSPRPAAPPAPL